MTAVQPRHPDHEIVRGGSEFAPLQPVYMPEDAEAGVGETADTESNELHGGGELTCGRCGRPLDDHTDIRRTTAGTYVHESCE